MSREMNALTGEQFVGRLRDCLNHLYDPNRLRHSPLAALFGVADRFDTPSALYRILTDAIKSLKPSSGEPPRAPARRIYELLFYRYIQQFSQQEVADQLGISVRQLRREQQGALEALAFRLWEQFELGTRLPASTTLQPAHPDGVSIVQTVNDELAWLTDAPLDDPADLNQTLSAVLDLARPLATGRGVQFEVTAANVLPKLAVHPVALRQILLNLLSVAIGWAERGQVTLSAELLRWEVRIEVQGTGSHSDAQRFSGSDAANLDMARRLVSLCGGRLAVPESAPRFSARLVLPVLERLPVLVIDDNVDTLQLLQRYASSTRYHLVCTHDPEQALSLAEKLSPQIIVLDVMMPQVDGWEVLGRLRQHPLTGHVPIVVCTILTQEELALTLGASDYVAKPVTRQAFLAALDRQVALLEPGFG